MSTKIVADVEPSTKEHLKEIAYQRRISMKEAVVQLVEEEYNKIKPKTETAVKQ